MKRHKQSGFTLVEVALTVTFMGALMVITFPRIQETLLRESVRGARRTAAVQLAQARGTAASRGCDAVIHFVSGDAGRIWVTSCAVTGTGLDTIGPVNEISAKYNVAFRATADSIVFAPTGMAVGGTWQALGFARGSASDTLAISPLGRAAR